ncbi:MAG: Hpt domain-containing protein [Halothece sp.]
MSDNQQRILGYFIEEAKEHLATLEQGLLKLSQTSTDSEQIDELFRAAHSIKGGGAMLGYGSIQKTAHRLEDSFKVFRDGKVNVDEKLESLFLTAFDVLKDLITRLENPEGLTEVQGKELVKSAEPQFKELQQHLDHCADIKAVIADLGEVEGEGEAQAIPVEVETATESPLDQVRPLLREMLNIFQNEDTPESRQSLREICDRAQKVASDDPNWRTLLSTAKSAIANPKHSYTTLAPIIIQEIKHGSDCLELGEPENIQATATLKNLAQSPTPQVLIPADPQAAAELLKRIFNQQQLSELKEKIGV